MSHKLKSISEIAHQTEVLDEDELTKALVKTNGFKARIRAIELKRKFDEYKKKGERLKSKSDEKKERKKNILKELRGRMI